MIYIKLMVLSLHSQSDQTRGHRKPLSDPVNKPFIFNDFFSICACLRIGYCRCRLGILRREHERERRRIGEPGSRLRVQRDQTQRLFAAHVRNIISRTNRYTGLRYADDPTIMSWQICNEPRAFSADGKDAFVSWIRNTAALIDSLAPRQLVSTGSEGMHGCEEDMELFERIHAVPQIDYINIHIWPYNWGWARKDSIVQSVERAKTETGKYIEAHAEVARRLGKPMVLEEFGYPRDGFSFSKQSPTTARDSYYKYVFSVVQRHAETNGPLAGCNFWAWGGDAEPSTEHVYWLPGDDYTGDPAQEEQGLNSVFTSDKSTMALVRQANDNLSHTAGRR